MNQYTYMQRTIGVICLVIGVVLLVEAHHMAMAIESQLTQLTSGEPTQRTTLFRIGGAALTIFEASAAGEVERVERLLSQSEPSGGYSGDGWTPLHLAAFFGHARIIELLLAHRADVTARSRNSNGNTALHAALAGQFALEQTFHIDVANMVDANRSPIRILERMTGTALS